MYSSLNAEQLSKLKNVLYVALINIEITENQSTLPSTVNQNWMVDLQDFFTHKRISGCSEKTLKKYDEHLFKLLSYINKDTRDITDTDIYDYMNSYKRLRSVSNRSLDNMRLVYSSFFSWANDHNRIKNNPMKMVNKIKTEYIIKKPFTDEERVKLSYACEDNRERAIMDILYSTCMRVGELEKLNISDVNFDTREITVFGKGSKERVVYLNANSVVSLRNYLIERDDDNPALFVGKNKNHNRLRTSGIEVILKNIGNRVGIKDVHPHRFRRTGATNALNRGMPIQEVSAMLGHVRLETTQIYCTIDSKNVKHSHDKYLSA